MSERFFSHDPITTDLATLSDQEAHHLLHVMRLKQGARVTLFDGSGAEFEAEVQRCGRREVELAVLSRQEVDRELPHRLIIAAALPKGDRQRWMVEKLTELGVSQFQPIETERSVIGLSSNALEKLRRAVVEASKQCRRNRLMEIAPAKPWAELLACAEGETYLAHPSAQCVAVKAVAGPITLAIGPEGGFTDEEAAIASAEGWRLCSLGDRILRTETAAIAGAALAGAGMKLPG